MFPNICKCVLCHRYARKAETFWVEGKGAMHRTGKGCRRAKIAPEKVAEVVAKKKPTPVAIPVYSHPLAGADLMTAMAKAGLIHLPA